MAYLDAHGNPIIVALPQAPAPVQAAGQPLIDVNGPRTALSNPKADIPLYYEGSKMDNVSAKFLLDRIRNARTTYGWSDETTNSPSGAKHMTGSTTSETPWMSTFLPG